MKITVVTLFPEMLSSFFAQSIVKRAQDKKLVEIDIVNLRDYSKDSYKTVDGRPYGGGAGMVLMIEPIADAINKLKINNEELKIKEKIILTSPRGAIYSQEKARKYASLDHLVIIAGHYEGVDERVLTYIDEEISIGDFVMTGGEIAAAAIVDSVVRLIKNVLKKDEAIEKESFFTMSLDELIRIVGSHTSLIDLKNNGTESISLLEYPHYTRPIKYEDQKVPDVLLSGHHAEIEKWRIQQAFEITLSRRPDLLIVKKKVA